jgi:hypothetical protein
LPGFFEQLLVFALLLSFEQLPDALWLELVHYSGQPVDHQTSEQHHYLVN